MALSLHKLTRNWMMTKISIKMESKRSMRWIQTRFIKPSWSWCLQKSSWWQWIVKWWIDVVLDIHTHGTQIFLMHSRSLASFQLSTFPSFLVLSSVDAWSTAMRKAPSTHPWSLSLHFSLLGLMSPLLASVVPHLDHFLITIITSQLSSRVPMSNQSHGQVQIYVH